MKQEHPPFSWKAFALLFGAGLLGVFSLIPYARRQVTKALAEAAEPPKVPVPLLVPLALFQSALLLALAVFGGLKLAPRLRLRSHLAAWAEPDLAGVRPEQPLAAESWPALIGALLTPALIFLGEALFRPWTKESLEILEKEQPRSLSYTLMGVLYGGIVEELLMRWGVVSLLARLLQRLRGEGKADPDPGTAVMWPAIGLAAILFGLGHLPALAALVTLTPALVARTVLVNAAGALVFGFLYWKESLEAAMFAHGGSHVVMSLVQWLRR